MSAVSKYSKIQDGGVGILISDEKSATAPHRVHESPAGKRASQNADTRHKICDAIAEADQHRHSYV